MIEPEIAWGRRAFPEAQRLFDEAGSPGARWPGQLDTGWHSSSVHEETGAFALVRSGAGLDDLIGEVIEVRTDYRSVLVYVLASRDIEQQLSLTRRAFLALALLTKESISTAVRVVA